MTRLIAVVATIVALAAAAVAAAFPASTLTGTAVWTADTYAVQGTFAGGIGKGTYAGTLVGGDLIPTTGTCGPTCQTVTGSITFTSKRGEFTAAVQAGGVVAISEIASHSFRNFDLTLQVVDGTRGYAHADGVLTLAYSSIWTHIASPAGLESHIDDAGTLTGNPH
jgi:hypothetical protein